MEYIASQIALKQWKPNLAKVSCRKGKSKNKGKAGG
jgi:hypothetical protein